MLSVIFFMVWCYCFLALTGLVCEAIGWLGALIWLPLRLLFRRVKPAETGQPDITSQDAICRYRSRTDHLDAALGLRPKH